MAAVRVKALVKMAVRAANFFTVSIDSSASLCNKLRDFIVATLKAANTVRPAQSFQKLQTLFFRAQFVLNGYQALSNPRCFGHD